MKGAERRAAIAAYKERKVLAGVFAMRCAASGEVWVGGAPNLDGVENRFLFQLRLGSCRSPSLQSAWNLRTPDDFAFEVLERIDSEATGYLAREALKERIAAWRAQLNAQPL
ncbi:MAG TPA: GIY-YIG nuclease family protein [Phenylobacterium sp.]